MPKRGRNGKRSSFSGPFSVLTLEKHHDNGNSFQLQSILPSLGSLQRFFAWLPFCPEPLWALHKPPPFSRQQARKKLTYSLTEKWTLCEGCSGAPCFLSASVNLGGFFSILRKEVPWVYWEKRKPGFASVYRFRLSLAYCLLLVLLFWNGHLVRLLCPRLKDLSCKLLPHWLCNVYPKGFKR